MFKIDILLYYLVADNQSKDWHLFSCLMVTIWVHSLTGVPDVNGITFLKINSLKYILNYNFLSNYCHLFFYRNHIPLFCLIVPFIM